MSRRALLAFIMLPLWLLIERAAYYGMRAGSITYMIEGLGLSTEDAVGHMSRSSVMFTFSPIIGGLIAIATGPRITLLIGALLMMVAYAVLGTGWDNIAAIIAIVALGRGLASPSVWAIAGSDLEGYSENSRNALFLACYLTVNLGAFAGTWIVSLLHGFMPTGFYLLAAAMIGPAVMAAILLGFDLTTPRVPPKRPSSAAAGALLVTLMAVPAFLVMGVVDQMHHVALIKLGDGASLASMARMLNPAVVSLFAIFGLVILLIMQNNPLQLRTMHLMGAGSVLLAFSAAPVLAGVETMVAILLAMGIAAVGEVLLAMGIVRVASGVHPRATTALVAVWMTATSGSSLFGGWIPSLGEILPVVLGIGAALTIGAAVLLVALAKTFDETFF